MKDRGMCGYAGWVDPISRGNSDNGSAPTYGDAPAVASRAGGVGKLVRLLKLGVAVPALAFGGHAFAQSTDVSGSNQAETNSDDSKAKSDDIVVTGTLIRGQAPTGQEVKVIGSEQIARIGAANTSQLLSVLPQDAAFNSRPQVGSYGQYQSINTPLLRQLGNNSTASSATLLLLDGMRLPGMGILQTTADIDAIAPGAIERLDVVTDGGSATYGADAVGGVLNIVTRKRFDGVEMNGHFGGAADFKQYDVGGTVGKTWSNGSIWVSYQYAHHDLVRNSDRDYINHLDYTKGAPYPPFDNHCAPGNYVVSALDFTTFTFNTTIFPIANGAPVFGANPVANRCDTDKHSTFFPSETRHSVMAGFDVDLSSSISFDVKAFYVHRLAITDGGDSGAGAQYEVQLPTSIPPILTNTVYGNISPTFGYHNYGRTTLDSWSVRPRITAKLGHDWQATAFLNVGSGYSEFSQRTLDPAALTAATAAGDFNPYTGLFANTPSGQAAQDYQRNYFTFSSGKDEITNARAVIDGPLFKMPGGDVRIAFGGEWLHERFTQRNALGELDQLVAVPHSADRSVDALFGELSVPLVGEGNRFAGIYALTLSAAGRYDHYSDFGGVFDPKFGISLKPVSWWTLRGTWSKSFQAPSLASTASALPPGVVAVPAVAFGGNPAFPDTNGKTILLLYPGGGVGLKPQKATTWEIGTDFRPNFLPGFSASVTYYNVKFKDQITSTAFFLPSFYQLYPNSYIMNDGTLTSQQISQYISSAYNASAVAQYVSNPSSVYALEDARQQNLAATKTSGIDFKVDYEHATGFGSIFGSVGGTYILTYNQQATPTSPVEDWRANQTIRLRTTATLGATVGNFLGQATWNRTGGFPVAPTTADDFQSHVGAFNVVNLAFQYTFPKDGVLHGTKLTLNVDNVFDQVPPYYRTGGAGGNGYYGFTLGRLAQIGFNTKF